MATEFPIIDANSIFGFWPLRNADIAIATLLQTAQTHRVARSLVVSTTGILYDFRAGNDETLATAQANAQSLFPVATLDPRQYLDCAGEIDKRVQQGFRLFRFFPDIQNWPLTFAPFRELLTKLESSGVPVMVPVNRLGQATQLADMVALNSTPLIISGVNYANLGEAIAVMKSDSKIYLETHLLNSPDGIEVVASEVGCERLVFGSFSPLRYISSALWPVLNAKISDEQKTAILSGNIRKLLAPTK